jgi:hypothetical protein
MHEFAQVIKAFVARKKLLRLSSLVSRSVVVGSVVENPHTSDVIRAESISKGVETQHCAA